MNTHYDTFTAFSPFNELDASYLCFTEARVMLAVQLHHYSDFYKVAFLETFCPCFTHNYRSVGENNSVADPKIINGHKASYKAKNVHFCELP
jgi:hypothetical protein